MPTVMSKPIENENTTIVEPFDTNDTTFLETLPDPETNTKGFIQHIYHILKCSFKEIKEKEGEDMFELRFNLKEDDSEYIKVILAVINVYCKGEGYIHPTAKDIINGEVCNKILIVCSNWKNLSLKFKK